MTLSASVSSRWADSLARAAMDRASSDEMSLCFCLCVWVEGTARRPLVAVPDAVALAVLVEEPGHSCRRQGLQIPVDGPLGALEFLGDALGGPGAVALDHLQDAEDPGQPVALANPPLRIGPLLGHRREAPGSRRSGPTPGAMLADVSDKDGSAD